MKSKTKTILIFAAILAAVFLVAFLDGSAMQSAAEEEEEGTLIGAFVSEEDIDIGGDLAVSAAGKFVWKAGGLYMETDDWSALGERGGGIYCTMEPDARYGEEDAKSPNITIFGALGAPLILSTIISIPLPVLELCFVLAALLGARLIASNVALAADNDLFI